MQLARRAAARLAAPLVLACASLSPTLAPAEPAPTAEACPRVSAALGQGASASLYRPALKSRADAGQRLRPWTVRSRACGLNDLDRAAIPASDHALAAQVVSALRADSRLLGEIEVAARDGVVQLIGQVASVSMLYRAIERAEAVEGVLSVDDGALLTF